MESTVVWRDEMAFDAHLEGTRFTLDADPEFGGQGLGPKPKGLLLTSLIGCTAMDVIAILAKMRLHPERFEVSARGELAARHPKKYEEITVTYDLEGRDVTPDRLLRAVSLSTERYCGVFATLKPTVELHIEVILNGERIDPKESSEASRASA